MPIAEDAKAAHAKFLRLRLQVSRAGAVGDLCVAVDLVLSEMKRPRGLTILMWFCALYAIGALIGIIAVLLDLGRFIGGYTIGGMAVNRGTWLRIAGPLLTMVALLMAATASALKPLGET
jgi:hypothetical protein